MRTRFPRLSKVARALAFALVGIAIVLVALQFRTPRRTGEAASAPIAAAPDTLAQELKRCQLISDQAKDDPSCEAAWAESRRRFFTYAPAPAGNSAATTSNEGR